MTEPKPKPKYTLEKLLAQCDPKAPLSEEGRAWTSSTAVSREEI